MLKFVFGSLGIFGNDNGFSGFGIFWFICFREIFSNFFFFNSDCFFEILLFKVWLVFINFFGFIFKLFGLVRVILIFKVLGILFIFFFIFFVIFCFGIFGIGDIFMELLFGVWDKW